MEEDATSVGEEGRGEIDGLADCDGDSPRPGCEKVERRVERKRSVSEFLEEIY